MNVPVSRDWRALVAAGVAVVFGILTILSGGRALFGDTAARTAVGDAVPFVLWFNFLSGFVYVAAGIGIALVRPWAPLLAIGLALAIALVFAFFGLHVFRGGAFEMRTAGAMTLRLAVWVAIAAVAGRSSSARDPA